MDWLSVILLAVGLAMDCLAVSTIKGAQNAGGKAYGKALLMAVLFGLFQGGMPLIGYGAGSLFVTFVSRFNHWIALVLLTLVGGKMIWESRPSETKMDHSAREADRPKRGEGKKGQWTKDNERAHLSYIELLTLAVATSIDALATGVIFTPLAWREVLIDVTVIGLTSFFFSRLGFRLGQAMGRKLHLNVELLGGLVLIGIGVKIFLEGIGVWAN